MRRPSATSSKTQWRHWAKRVRSSLPLVSLSAEVSEKVRACPLYQKAQHVLTYSAFGSEMDLSSLQNDSAKTFYLTRTWELGQDLTLHHAKGELERHPYGYLQPTADVPRVPPTLLDLILVPGLCFDQQGTRLGYGGGFYDRLLPELREDVPRVGITVRELVVASLPGEALDIPMTHLATEVGVTRVPS